MRKLSGLMIAALLVGLLALSNGRPARADGGVTPEQLAAADWFCVIGFAPGGSGVGCFPPSSRLGAVTLTPLIFDTSGNLLGTVILLRADKYHGQPCPSQGTDEWLLENLLGVDYRACHHFELP